MLKSAMIKGLLSVCAVLALAPSYANAQPVTFTKAFGTSSIPLTEETTLSFTIINNDPVNSLSAIAFSDSLPAGLVVTSPAVITGTCPSGTITAVAGSSSISLSGAALNPFGNPNSSCVFSVEVTGAAAGSLTNTSGTLTATSSGLGPVTAGPATASIVVVAPPVLSKAFGAPKFALIGGGTTLTYTITNPAANTVPLTGVSITDNFPSIALLVGSPAQVSNSCGGTVTAITGGNSVSLSGGTVPASGSCALVVNVTGAPPGGKVTNSANVNSTNGGAGLNASASVVIVNPPVLTKSFSPPIIGNGSNSKLTFTITSPNSEAIASLTGVGFTDTLPAGLVISTPPNLLTNCVPSTPPNTAGTITATAGTTTITVANADLEANASCTISLNVTAVGVGLQVNTTSVVTSPNSGNAPAATANLTVIAPPVITKSFSPAQIPVSGVADLSTLTLTLLNPNTVTASGTLTISFTDTLPGGVLVATPNGLSGSCPLGTVTATAGSGSISSSGLVLAANSGGTSSCTISVNVTGTTVGLKTNSVFGTDPVAGAGPTSTATLLVVGPPTLTKTFPAGGIPFLGSSPVTFVIANPNPTTPLTGVGFTDNLVPSFLTVASTPNVTGTCLALVPAPTVSAVAGSSNISITGLTLAGGASCTFIVNVVPGVPGPLTNVTGAPTSNEGGPGLPATGTTFVVSPPSLVKTFCVPSIPVSGVTCLTFTITNPSINTVPLLGVNLSDTLAAGLVVASPNGLTPAVNPCGGTVTAVPGSSTVSLSGGTIAASPTNTCTFSINVTGTTPGSKVNTTTPGSTNGGPGTPSTPVTLNVFGPPTLTKSFGAPVLPLGGSTTLTLTLGNPASNPGPLTGIGFTDALPAGLVISTPPGLSATTCIPPGTITAVAAATSLSVSGVTLAAGSTCSFSVNVTLVTAGVKNNTTSTVTSNEGGSGPPATATTMGLLPPFITKSFTPGTISSGGQSTLGFTITNPAANTLALTGVGFTDNLPIGMIIATPNGLSGTCGGGVITALAGSSTVTLVGATLTVSGSCTFSVNVTATVTGTNSVTVNSTNAGTGNTATATLTVNQPLTGQPTITKSFATNTVAPGGTVALTITISNPSPSTLIGVGFTDPINAPLQFASLTSNSCGPTLTTTLHNIALSGATLTPFETCTIVVNILANAPAGTELRVCNVTSAVTPGGLFAATACITIGTTVIEPDAFQIVYAANLNDGDSFINLSNSGVNGGFVGAIPPTLGNICANVYVFNPGENMISCCTCLVTPNGLNSLSVINDLISNPLTSGMPTSVTVDLVGTSPVNGVCNAGSSASVGFQTLTGGLIAWGTTLEPNGSFGSVGTIRVRAKGELLSTAELNALTATCGFIQGDGSGFGICKSCRTGGLSGTKF